MEPGLEDRTAYGPALIGSFAPWSYLESLVNHTTA